MVVDEKPLRTAMYRFSINLLLFSLAISILTAALVYLALHYLFVRPMRRVTDNLVAFHADPESPARIITPSDRGDEIGMAERELSAMQRDLVSMLHQKSRLAALGLAVSKINHDLRNLLASAQLISDQLATVPDPRVQRFAPKLMRSLERAIDFCQSTLSYGRAQEAAPDRRRITLDPVINEVRESLALAADTSITWVSHLERGLTVDADPDQLFRILLNLARNAVQALESARAGRDDGLPDQYHRQTRGQCHHHRGFGLRSRRAGRRRASTCSRRSRVPPVRAAPASASTIAAELVRAHGGQIRLVDSNIGATFRIEIPDRPVDIHAPRSTERASA